MLVPLLLGWLAVIISMVIQVTAVVVMLRYLMRIVSDPTNDNAGILFDCYVISIVLLVLFTGHLLQVGAWATLFQALNEFSDFQTAFYHSMVNFTSLGYGDIVMSERWRLLGALEASVGILMFGLSAGILVAVMNPLFARHSPTKEQVKQFQQKK
ncbi:MAG: two pore domain potassium channel family protein [Gammaproteobacteria bacterium]|jgi:ABC-type phosphate/phosphonate transport system permease subunit|nr:two pore domain potassium channel family protein [Gammaproteobacteria bacterium]